MINPLEMILAPLGRFLEFASPRCRPPSQPPRVARRGGAERQLTAVRLTLAALAAEPLVLLDLPLSREYFLELFRTAGVEPQISRRVADPELARSLVAWGYGYTLANARPAPTQAIDGTPLRAIPLRGPVHAPNVGLARRAGLEPTRSAAAFAEVCAELLSAPSRRG